MSADASSVICKIAPALRGLLGKGQTLPVVAFRERHTGDGGQKVEVVLSDMHTPEKIIGELRQVIEKAKQPVQKVWIHDVGMFEVLPVNEGLTGRVSGKITVVTGAAQGLGLEITWDLLSQGAYVVLADIQLEAALAQVKNIEARYGPGRALALDMNVKDQHSISRAMARVVKTYGGLDLLIANAGVLKAGSVKTQRAEDFQSVTDVNYTGYFLCVQQVAPILSLQHLAHKAYTSDIIQVNSKSGLQGSNRNSAYAGSKFGGIGLTQSFALELMEDGIKVNAVCPGNFFDGPLWSDPDNGLFVQYLRTGKVPGARTIEDVRRAYEAKVPMGRGCTCADVMKAVYYLIDQQYETGQALPVTGGQIMLH